MGLFDSMKDKAQDIMDDPEKKERIEQIAREKGLTIEEAKDHFMRKEERGDSEEEEPE